jgi:hypothetical protein
MSITYTWKIKSLKTHNTDTQNKFVFQTYWTKTGTDENGNEGVFSGATPFSPTSNENFVPFESLTEEVVLGWVKEVVIGDYEEHVNAQIQKEIDKTLALAQDTSMPWASEGSESSVGLPPTSDTIRPTTTT